MSRRVMARIARRGRSVRLGVAGGARRGERRLGEAWQGKAWQVRQGQVGPGLAGVGEVRLGRLGKVRLGPSRHGRARLGSAGAVRQRFGRAPRGASWFGQGVIHMSDYVWQKGSRLTDKLASAQVVGVWLERLEQENGGRLTTRVVVDAARPTVSPLHPLFEWDDLRAAELYREDQARYVLSCIRIVEPSTDPSDAPRTIHAYVSLVEDIDGEKQRAYVPVARVFSDVALLQQAIERAAAELRAFENRYAEFDAIARVARTAREQIEALEVEGSAVVRSGEPPR